MTDQEPEVVDAEPVTEDEVREAVKDTLDSTAITVSEPGDLHEGMVAMDAHDAAKLLERITRQAQEHNLGKRWVYEFPDGKGGLTRGLTIDAVEDITQQMNWTGRCAIGVLPDTLDVEVIDADEGHGDEKFWVATVAAIDERTGARQIGTAMEPQNMRLRNGKTRFDRFARTKALGKAQRNAMEHFIPEVVKLTLISMAAKNPSMVERIESDAEAKVRELPPPLDTPEAKKLIGELGAMYDEIRDLGGGRGKVLLTPGQYHAYLVQSQHDMELLGRMKDWLTQRRDEIREQVKADA